MDVKEKTRGIRWRKILMQKQLDKFGLITIWFAVLYWGGHLIVSLTK